MAFLPSRAVSTTFLKIVVVVMTSGLPQICKHRLEVCKGMLPAKHLVQRILMAINYCGCQITRWFWKAALANHKKEGAMPHPGVCKFSLHYEGRTDGRFGVRIVMRNLVSLRRNWGEVCEHLRRRIIYVCLVLGMKGRRYNLWWSKKEMKVVVWESR